MKSSIAPLLVLAPVLSLVALPACETEYTYAQKQAADWAAPRPDPVLVVRHHVGGTHYRAVTVGSLAYVTFGESLIVIATDTGNALHSLELMPFGTSGAATELLAVDGGSGE